MKCCVSILHICITLHIIRANMDLHIPNLDYESTHTQISYILYFIKISKLPTQKGQCRLEDIVINLLPGINNPVQRQNNK